MDFQIIKKSLIRLFLILGTVCSSWLSAREEKALPDSQVSETHKIVRRAAFDIGSAQVKLQVSDVDLSVGKIANVVFTDHASIALREDLAKSLDGRLSADVQDKLVAEISELMKKAKTFHPEAFHAIATETLRLAGNGNELVERVKKETGLEITIISREEEGIIGFINALNNANVDPDKAVSWDFGAGSFQITTKCQNKYLVYQGKLGKVAFKNVLLDIQKKSVEEKTPNPISKVEADQAVLFVENMLIDLPKELREKLNSPHVVTLGVGINPLWGMPNSSEYTINDVLNELNAHLDLDDEAVSIKDSIEMVYAKYRVTNMIFSYGVMKALGIQQIQYLGTEGGNAVGVLLSEKYWK